MVSLFQAFYTDTTSCVRIDGCNSEWFPILSGVRQGCAVAPDTFLERTVHRGMVGTTIRKKEGIRRWCGLTNGDVVCASQRLKWWTGKRAHLEWVLTGPRPNYRIWVISMDGANQTATVLGNQVVESFSPTYLGCLIHCSGSSEPEINQATSQHSSWGNVFSI